MLFPPGIIEHSLPERNKYTDFNKISTSVVSQLTSLQKHQLTRFIKANYLRERDNVFMPHSSNILPYFTGHSEKSFISFYHEDTHLLDSKQGNVITHKTVSGCITSRPLNVIIYKNRQQQQNSFRAYYVDYLCVHKEKRKNGIAPKLIQTHHYQQRHINHSIVVSLFKREEELTGIVPLCVYLTYGFPVDTWRKPNDLAGNYKVLEINKHNVRFLIDFVLMKCQDDDFDLFIYPEWSNVLELINTHNIFIYAVLCDNEIVCCYFFRKSCTQVKKGMEVLSCFASLSNCDDSIFIQGFKSCFWKIAFDHHFGFSAIENISHNHIIIDHIKEHTSPVITSPSAYFFYNFAYPTFEPKKTLILN